MAEKSFYWIKLRTDFFDSDTVDFLMSQTNGANYVVLYQMLCLKTTSTEGGLYSEMGEIVVPYNVEKISRLTKYFDVDTIRVALELYKKLGLVYVQEDGILKIAGYKDLVGYESQWAEKKRAYRERMKALNEDNVRDMSSQLSETKEDNVREEIEIRDRDKSLEIESTTEVVKKENAKEKKRYFSKPTLEEAQAYADEKGYRFSVEQWFAYYESNGWKVGKNPMKSWKASMSYWNGNNSDNRAQGKKVEEEVDHGYNPLIDRIDNDEEGNPWQ